MQLSFYSARLIRLSRKKASARNTERDPQACKKVASPEKAPTAEAAASVICNGEHELGNQSLFLLEDVKVTQIGKGSPYKPGVDFNVDDLDPQFLIYPIRGSFKKYQFGKPDKRRRKKLSFIRRSERAGTLLQGRFRRMALLDGR